MQKEQCQSSSAIGGFFYRKMQQGTTILANNKAQVLGTLAFGAGFLFTLWSTKEEDLKLIAKQQSLIKSRSEDNAVQRKLLAGELDEFSENLARIQQATQELIDELEGNQPATSSACSSSTTTDPDDLEDKVEEINQAQMTLFEYQAVMMALQQRREEQKKSKTTSLRLN